jgi:large subunit ribosomal protein L13
MSGKTFSLSKEAAIQARGWRIVDAAGIPLGILASHVASLIRGKNKPIFTPHVDCGDFVIVLNAEKIALSGRKADNKMYHHHTGFLGGLKSVSAGTMRQNNPERLIETAVAGMLPKGALGHQMIKKLKVARGGAHPHGAHKPVPYEIKLSGAST